MERMDVDEDSQLTELTAEQLEDWLNESVLPNYTDGMHNNKCVKALRELRYD